MNVGAASFSKGPVVRRAVRRGQLLRYLHPMFLKRILYYLNPASLVGRSKADLNLRFMHGINRISILLFLVCIVVMVVKACNR